jgi:ubiquinone biosynthesis protein UbiJ
MTSVPSQPAFEPRSFFEVLLPALLHEREAAAVRIDAVVQFYLMGTVDLAWYADLTQMPVGVVAGEHESPDLTVAVAAHRVLALATGNLQVPEALADESLQVAGDRRVLQALAELFQGGFTGMGIRYAAVRKSP